mgnify:CR=1 FL=1
MPPARTSTILQPRTGKLMLLVFGMLSSGAVNTLSKKYQFDTCAPALHKSEVTVQQSHECVKRGYPADYEPFNKPWLQNMMNFLGELTCLLFLRVCVN